MNPQYIILFGESSCRKTGRNIFEEEGEKGNSLSILQMEKTVNEIFTPSKNNEIK
jgi:hypothetical protein